MSYDDDTLAGLERAVREMADEIDSLRSQLGRLDRVESDLRDLEYDHEQHVESLDEAVAEARESADSAQQGVQLLRRRVGWLSRYVHRVPNVEEVNLDDVGEAVIADLRAADTGRRAAADPKLLPPPQRESLEQTVQQRTYARDTLDKMTEAVLVNSRSLAENLPPSGVPPQFRDRASRYVQSVHEYKEASRAMEKAETAAKRARSKLREDDELRRAVEPYIRGGKESQVRASEQLRRRIAAGVDADVHGKGLLPEWLIVAIGSPRNAKPQSSWIDTAVDILAYRATYGITDRTVALGAQPVDDAIRAAWYQRLKNLLVLGLEVDEDGHFD